MQILCAPHRGYSEPNFHQLLGRYAGQVGFSTGEWLGIELDQPQGKNDGSVQGQRYFSCTRDYGLFVRTITARPIYTPHGRSF